MATNEQNISLLIRYVQCPMLSLNICIYLYYQVSELDIGTVGWGLVTLAIGLVFRMTTSFFVVMGGNLNVKERLFVALAWVPKATVQVICFMFYVTTFNQDR